MILNIFFMGLLAHFLIGLSVFLVCKRSLYVLDTNPLSEIISAHIFAQTVVYIFTLLLISFETQQFLILMESLFPSMDHAVGVVFKNVFLYPLCFCIDFRISMSTSAKSLLEI